MRRPLSPPSRASRSASLRPIMPAAPVMSTCTSLLPEAAWRCLTHGVQLAQAHPLPPLRVEILRREPALEGNLARRPFAVEHGVIRRVAAAALADHVLPERAFVNEAVAQRRPARRVVEHVALPFVAPVAERLEGVAPAQILRLPSDPRPPPRPPNN